MVQVTITGIDKVEKYIMNLPAKIDKEGTELTRKLADMIASHARMLVAPFNTGTGDLRKSIDVSSIPHGHRVSAGAFRQGGINYGWYQELGFTPHYIHRDMLDSRVRNKTRAKFWKVSRATPFMMPSLRSVVSRLNTELNRTADRIVRG